jgi:hypothetical protein
LAGGTYGDLALKQSVHVFHKKSGSDGGTLPLSAKT